MKKRTYKLTGLLYLLVIICAGLSQGYVRETIVVPGDAFTTAGNILQNEFLFRMGLTMDLVAFITDAVISVIFYQMFKPYGKTMSMVSATLRLIAHPAIGSLNLLNHYMAFHVLGNAEFLTQFPEGQLYSLSLLFMDAHKYGYLIAGGFFGIHCILLGILIRRSIAFPNIFGILLMVSGAGYLIETFGNFLAPVYETYTALIVGISAGIGEVALMLFLLIRGKRETP